MLDANELIFESGRSLLGFVDDGPQWIAEIHRATLNAGQPAERLLDLVSQLLARRTELLQHGGNRALGLLQKRSQQMLGLEHLMIVLARETLSAFEGFLRFDGETIDLHDVLLDAESRAS